MPVGLLPVTELLPISGVSLATTNAGVKQAERDDVLLMALAEGSEVAAVFTQNAFCAAPVVLAKTHLAATKPQYLLVNSGNANAGTGEPGMQAALETCEAVAANTRCAADAVLPFSTGVIGELLPSAKIADAVPALLSSLSENHWVAAAKAIMTTDTMAKGISQTVDIGGQTITITGIAKGSGMICPNMATMLSYVATDAKVDAALLQKTLSEGVDRSFNSITVDGDTSTNDACVLVATGSSNVSVSGFESEFKAAVELVLKHLAQSIIRDGEGATKFVSVIVDSANDDAEAKQVAYTVAHSPLVKTALFASDPNWGRILAAVGRAGIDNLDVNLIDISLGDVCIVEAGGKAQSYTEAQGQAVMLGSEIIIRVTLNRGDCSRTVWTTDLSYDYVKINAEYRT
ncbi:MAG: bifunctional glutamate N-acetyltransferase/amino-acid acetyltransferase ArgJ [Methylococcales bacterium]|jgi:glutamate N-acetyltransferase / amino-acid N-acetyltransferase|nr:bifunctional glutamate N-acetyltransferase/amino-acid acetyltransferase ArgJ [Methylococcales bacterium]